MIQFIDEVHGVQANRLLQSVRADLNNPYYIVAVAEHLASLIR